MSITGKTRKLLWGRSGSFCAICKSKLIVEATADDDESIVGDECHMISPKPNGPRHDPTYPQERLDAYENLLLLCKVDHKKVDDQSTTFTAEIPGFKVGVQWRFRREDLVAWIEGQQRERSRDE